MSQKQWYSIFIPFFSIFLSFCHDTDIAQLVHVDDISPHGSDPSTDQLTLSIAIPAMSLPSGEIPVMIHGTHLFRIATLQGNAKVFFDGVPADKAIVQSDDTLIAWVPAYTKTILPKQIIPIAISVKQQDGKLVTANGLFSYHELTAPTTSPIFTSDSTKQVLSQDVVGSHPFSMVTGDLNADGLLDFAVSSYDATDQNVRIFLGDQKNKGEFLLQPLLSVTGPGLSSLALGDINQDGHLDIVVAEREYQQLEVFLGKGDGTFQAPLSVSLQKNAPSSLELADINQDGKLDVVLLVNAIVVNVVNGQKVYDSGHTIQIWIGDGKGSFSKETAEYEVGKDPSELILRDLNGDTKLDLVASSYQDHTVSIFLNNQKPGDGKVDFMHFSTFEVGFRPKALALGDVTGDQMLDLVVGTEGGFFSIYQGKGTGAFEYINTISGINPYSYSLALADFNLDGTLDIAAAGPLENGISSTLVIFSGTGGGQFESADSWEVGKFPSRVITGDVNQDGKPDVLTVNRGFETMDMQSSVRILLNQTVQK